MRGAPLRRRRYEVLAATVATKIYGLSTYMIERAMHTHKPVSTHRCGPPPLWRGTDDRRFHEGLLRWHLSHGFC